MIPKIIHQIMPRDKSRWHPIWKRCHPSWKLQFLDDEFEYKIWYDDELKHIIEEFYPEYVELFEEFPRHIMQIDFARFAILHKYGGIYADLDIYCYKNFYSYLNNKEVFLIGSQVPDRIVENSLMISVAGSEFFLECMKDTQKNFYTYKNTVDFSLNELNPEFQTKYSDMVTNTTGIYMVSKLFEKIRDRINVGVLNADLFQPPPSYYDKNLFTKHMCSNWWGREEYELAKQLYVDKYNGVETKNLEDFVDVFYSKGKLQGRVDIKNFDFYTNYFVEEQE
jgi:hypothetical protein